MDKLNEGLLLVSIDTNFSRIVKDLLNVSVLGLGAYQRLDENNFKFLVFTNVDLHPLDFKLNDPRFPTVEFYELANFFSVLERQVQFEEYTLDEILLNLAKEKSILTGQSLVAFAACELLKKPVKFVPFPDCDNFIHLHTLSITDKNYTPVDDVTDFVQEYLKHRNSIVRNEKINLVTLESRLKDISLLLYSMFSTGSCTFETIVASCISIQDALLSLGSNERLLIPNLSMPAITVLNQRKLTSIDFPQNVITKLKIEAENALKFDETLDLFALIDAINSVLQLNNVESLKLIPSAKRCTVSTFPHSEIFKFEDNLHLLSVEEMKRLLIELNRLTKSSVKWGSPIDPRIGEAMNRIIDTLSLYAESE